MSMEDLMVHLEQYMSALANIPKEEYTAVFLGVSDAATDMLQASNSVTVNELAAKVVELRPELNLNEVSLVIKDSVLKYHGQTYFDVNKETLTSVIKGDYTAARYEGGIKMPWFNYSLISNSKILSQLALDASGRLAAFSR